jgi:hypothetical protein
MDMDKPKCGKCLKTIENPAKAVKTKKGIYHIKCAPSGVSGR